MKLTSRKTTFKWTLKQEPKLKIRPPCFSERFAQFARDGLITAKQLHRENVGEWDGIPRVVYRERDGAQVATFRRFRGEEMEVLRCTVQMIGSWDPDSKTWLWGWANSISGGDEAEAFNDYARRLWNLGAVVSVPERHLLLCPKFKVASSDECLPLLGLAVKLLRQPVLGYCVVGHAPTQDGPDCFFLVQRELQRVRIPISQIVNCPHKAHEDVGFKKLLQEAGLCFCD